MRSSLNFISTLSKKGPRALSGSDKGWIRRRVPGMRSISLDMPASFHSSTSRFNGANSGSGSNANPSSGLGWKALTFTIITTSVSTFFVLDKFYFKSEAPREESIDRSWKKQKYGGMKEFLEALPEFQAFLDEDRITTEDEELKRHGYSEWSTYNIETNPIAIAYPKSTEEVSRIAKICHKFKLPMIGFSGGSSLEGNYVAPYGGICVDFALMDRILEVRPDDMDCTVQPAVGWMELNKSLTERGLNLFFGVDPGPTAKIGGMVSTSCSGTNCVKYGPMRDHIVNLTVVLADGTIIKTKRRPRKSSAGYNLNHLFSGAEGTLGLITEITVKLQVIPEVTTVAICPFPSVHQATATAADIIRAGVPVHAVELMDEVQMWAINKSGYTKRVWEEQPTLFFKFSGTKSYVKEQISQAKAFAKTHSGTSFSFAKSEEEAHQLWAARKEALWSLMALGPKGSKVYSTDIAVPISRLADLVMATKEELVKSGVLASALGHVGDGNFHASIMYEDQDYEKVRALGKNLVHRGLEMEGTCTGEHGIGAGKIDYLLDELGPDAVSLMHTIKLAVDPYELLNPGKIFTENSFIKYAEHERIEGSKPYGVEVIKKE